MAHIIRPTRGAQPSRPKRPAKRPPIPDAADALAEQLRLAGLPAPEREWRFTETRRWRESQQALTRAGSVR